VVSDSRSPSDTVERAALVHREILQLGVLIVVAVVAFLVTRAVAASNRDTTLRDAAEWYRRGQQQIEAGKLDAAVDSLRRATVRDRSNTSYALALAHALALNGDHDAARGALLTLRESAPEDAEINLQLARLAARQQDLPEALRFYHNALYAPWPVERADVRRRVRFELIEFLLANNQTSRALSELLAVITDLPDESAQRLEVAQLFAKAGDHRHALEQFQRALRLAPADQRALSGAGEAAFQLGDYPVARTYLRQLPPESNDARNTRDLVALVLSNDPLGKRLGSAERRRRLAADFAYVQERFSTCLAQRGGQVTDEERALQDEEKAFEPQLKPTAILEQDTIESGVDLIDRIEHRMVQMCGSQTILDHALSLIGRAHGADPR